MQEVKKAVRYVCDGCQEATTTIYDPPDPDPRLNGNLIGWRVTTNALVCPLCSAIVNRLEEAGYCLETEARSWKESRFIK